MGPDSAEYPEVIIASPLTRTIETALLAFEPLQPHLKVILMPELQENSDQACDTGSSIDVLSKRFPELSFEHIPKDWNSKSGRWASDDTSLDARALDALDRLSRREEQRIAVVTHGGFCSKLIQRWVRFENTECRVFKLVRGKRFSELQPVTMPGTEATRPLTTDMDAVGAMPQKDDGANFQDRSKPAP
jgi:broad specificity phosphatase PhoE